jgi:hypothetical protein
MGLFSNQPEDQHQPQRQVGAAVMPTREAVTKSQLESLHSIIQNLGNYLLAPRSHWMLDDDATPRKIDGGVAASAAVTFINVCNRIDEMLADKTRWDTSAHDALYESIAAVQKAQVKYLESQTDGQKVLARPSVQFHPTVANDGEKFICYYGDISKPGYAVVGLGATPAEAMQAFDRAFDKSAQEQIILAADTAAAQQTKSKRKSPKNEPPLDS